MNRDSHDDWRDMNSDFMPLTLYVGDPLEAYSDCWFIDLGTFEVTTILSHHLETVMPCEASHWIDWSWLSLTADDSDDFPKWK